ncbi:DUF4149 domain-containing protein [Azovibrio restrictus]|uniref:DUF4149 domain-containing protein n=1 Tax=Azovibrio restrictus TaxID=146938 RepID=UPI0026F05BB9|nr:DUF4149 domain-containing protein [Azovibrio restrictus]
MSPVRRLADALFQVALTLWVGGLWSIGYLVVPTLFNTLESRPLAGAIAASLFEVSGWAGLGLGIFLLLCLLLRQGLAALRTLPFWLAALMLILTAVSLFGIQPLMARMKLEALPLAVMESPLRERFSTWHGISSSLYLLQSLLALGLLLRLGRSGGR